MITVQTENKEVFFFGYCKNCKYLSKRDEEEPCCYCLEEPFNINSHKPVKFEEKEVKNNGKTS